MRKKRSSPDGVRNGANRPRADLKMAGVEMRSAARPLPDLIRTAGPRSPASLSYLDLNSPLDLTSVGVAL
jgi:hypothetical protein